jgi:long-subunit acyl-CoA synthetase (AMP-forming)
MRPTFDGCAGEGARTSLRGCKQGVGHDPDMWAEIEASVHRVNATLSHIETVKEWRIPRDFTIGAGEVTPTSSPPQEVNDQYDRLVEEMMYAERS